jgi:hypothetical protein
MCFYLELDSPIFSLTLLLSKKYTFKCNRASLSFVLLQRWGWRGKKGFAFVCSLFEKNADSSTSAFNRDKLMCLLADLMVAGVAVSPIGILSGSAIEKTPLGMTK